MKTLKTLALILVLVISLITMSGCGGDSSKKGASGNLENMVFEDLVPEDAIRRGELVAVFDEYLEIEASGDKTRHLFVFINDNGQEFSFSIVDDSRLIESSNNLERGQEYTVFFYQISEGDVFCAYGFMQTSGESD